MQTGASGRPAKRARLEADKRRDALAKVEDKYFDIDFTRFHRVEDESSGGATPPRFMLVRPTEAALVKDWRQWAPLAAAPAASLAAGSGTCGSPSAA